MCVGLSVCIYVCVRCAYVYVLLRVFCMYFCLLVGMSMHALICVRVSVYECLCMCVCVCVSVYVCLCMCLCMSVNVRAPVYVCVSVCVLVCMYQCLSVIEHDDPNYNDTL